MVAILNKFTVLSQYSYFVVYFLKSKLILFYDRVVYYYTEMFIILLPHPVYIYIYREREREKEREKVNE